MWIYAAPESSDFECACPADRFFCREKLVVLRAGKIPEPDAEGEAILKRIGSTQPTAQARRSLLQQFALTAQAPEPPEFFERPPHFRLTRLRVPVEQGVPCRISRHVNRLRQIF